MHFKKILHNYDIDMLALSKWNRFCDTTQHTGVLAPGTLCLEHFRKLAYVVILRILSKGLLKNMYCFGRKNYRDYICGCHYYIQTPRFEKPYGHNNDVTVFSQTHHHLPPYDSCS